MKPVEWSFLTREKCGTDYEYVCAVAQLEPTDEGWGFLHCIDDNGAHMTAVTDDPGYLEVIVSANGTPADSRVPRASFG